MTGLMTSVVAAAASASRLADHLNHCASSVRTSRRTLLSTRTSRPSVVGSSATGQGHDLVSAHPDRSAAAHALDQTDRKSTRLNSSHVKISYAVFCLKKKKK